jgi:hypothetical protein
MNKESTSLLLPHLRSLLGTDVFMYLIKFLQLTPELHRLWYPTHSLQPGRSKIHCSVCNLGIQWFIKYATENMNDTNHWISEGGHELFYCCREHFFRGARNIIEAEEHIFRHKLTDEYRQFLVRRRNHAELLVYQLRLSHH